MWKHLENDILDACNRRILAAERRRGRAADENRRRRRRSLTEVQLIDSSAPELWSLPGYNPFLVRRNRSAIAHAIKKRLQSREYSPRPAQSLQIAKEGGGFRNVTVFSIADEAISRRLFSALLVKNRSRLSSRSFAYRADINAQDAIRHLRSAWRPPARLFAAEYDLADFFDRISHDHIWRSLESLGFSLTDLERFLIGAFMNSPRAPSTEGGSIVAPRIGVPQGTSISLLLANVATGELDRKLETMAVDFVRYADDLLVWSSDYAAVSSATNEIWKWAADAGVPINPGKSAGIRVVVPRELSRAEIASTSEVTFLSHEIGLGAVNVGRRAIDRVKQRVSRLLYDNLLREPKRGCQNLGRLTGNDRDYATYIWQLRRYFYGSLSERELRRLETGRIPRMRFTGVMSHFPYSTRDEVLVQLDNWVLTQTWLAVRQRRALLESRIPGPLPVPWECNRLALLYCRAVSTRTDKPIDLRLPSALRMVTVARRSVDIHGVWTVERSSELY